MFRLKRRRCHPLQGKFHRPREFKSLLNYTGESNPTRRVGMCEYPKYRIGNTIYFQGRTGNRTFLEFIGILEEIVILERLPISRRYCSIAYTMFKYCTMRSFCTSGRTILRIRVSNNFTKTDGRNWKNVVHCEFFSSVV